MSYWFRLIDRATGQTCQFVGNHHMIGGTYALGGSIETHMHRRKDDP